MSRIVIFIAAVVIIILAIFIGSYARGYLSRSKLIPSSSTPTPVSTTISPSTVSTGTAAVKEFTITASNYSFNPKTISVNQGDQVKITLNNTQGGHDLRLDGYDTGTQVIQAGESDTFTFTALQSGQFEYYCSVDGHRAMGMVGTLTVN